VPIVSTPLLQRLVSEFALTVSGDSGVELRGFAILNPSDLEALEPTLSPSLRLASLLEARQEDAILRGQSLHNFCLSHALPGYGALKNEYLEGVFDNLLEEMQGVLDARRTRAPDGARSTEA
jgi:hypothetical protein